MNCNYRGIILIRVFTVFFVFKGINYINKDLNIEINYNVYLWILTRFIFCVYEMCLLLSYRHSTAPRTRRVRFYLIIDQESLYLHICISLVLSGHWRSDQSRYRP